MVWPMQSLSMRAMPFLTLYKRLISLVVTSLNTCTKYFSRSILIWLKTRLTQWRPLNWSRSPCVLWHKISMLRWRVHRSTQRSSVFTNSPVTNCFILRRSAWSALKFCSNPIRLQKNSTKTLKAFTSTPSSLSWSVIMTSRRICSRTSSWLVVRPCSIAWRTAWRKRFRP